MTGKFPHQARSKARLASSAKTLLRQGKLLEPMDDEQFKYINRWSGLRLFLWPMTFS